LEIRKAPKLQFHLMKIIKIVLSFFRILTFAFILTILPNALWADSSDFQLRKFDPEKIKAFKSDKAYDYGISNVENNQESSNLFWDLLQKLLNISTKSEMNAFWEVVSILLVIAFVGFIVIRIANAEKSWFWKSSEKNRKSFTHLEDFEHVDDADFLKLIESAIKNKDYKVAVRYFYLQMLKDLNTRKLITWKADKTNSDYIAEISSTKLKDKFSKTALIYEYIWYGDFLIQEDIFESARESFMAFKESINQAG
jgi:hypothetical protein